MTAPEGNDVLEFRPSGWGEWDAVRHLLSTPLMHSHCAPFLDVSRQSVNWDGLRRASGRWSQSERLIVSLAQNLWNGRGQVNVRGLVDTLDAASFTEVVTALRLARGMRVVEPAKRGRP